ncbi:MAG: hypothetical protein WA792_12905, partial [Pseudolabrys sp.]
MSISNSVDNTTADDDGAAIQKAARQYVNRAKLSFVFMCCFFVSAIVCYYKYQYVTLMGALTSFLFWVGFVVAAFSARRLSVFQLKSNA